MLRFQTFKVLDMNIRKSKRTLLMQFKAEYLIYLFDWGLAVWFLVQNGRYFLFRRLFWVWCTVAHLERIFMTETKPPKQCTCCFVLFHIMPRECGDFVDPLTVMLSRVELWATLLRCTNKRDNEVGCINKGKLKLHEEQRKGLFIMNRHFEKRKTCDHISFLTENRGLYVFTWSLTEGRTPMSMCFWEDAVYHDEISTIYPSLVSQLGTLKGSWSAKATVPLCVRRGLALVALRLG